MQFRKKSPAPLSPIGKTTDLKIEDNSLKIRCDNAALLLKAVSPEVVRVRAASGGDFEPDNSYAVVDGAWTEPHWDATWEGNEIVFSTSAMHVHIDKNTLAMEFSCGEDDVFLAGIGGSIGFRGAAPEWSFNSTPDEIFLGLGEKTGPMNKRGRKWTMRNSDIPYMPWTDPLYQSIPFVVGMKGGRCYGVFFDNTFKSFFDLAHSDPGKWTWSARDGEINAYIISGPSLRDVIRRYYRLVGGVPMPPRWALGYHQSRYSYKNETQVRQVAKNLRDLDIPCDVIHMDIHYMRGYRDFTFDPERFPNTKKMAADLKDDGYRLICIVDPGVKEDNNWEVWRDGVEKKVFCEYDRGGIVIKYCWPKRAGWPDFGREDVRRWWGEQHKVYFDNGIAGVWNDMNEPSMWNGAFYVADAVVPTGIYRGKGMTHTHFGKLESHDRCRNVYGMTECRATREGMLALRPDDRPLVITRSGYAGIGRYAIMWTGDNGSTWAHLRISIPMQINLGLSGEPIAGPDIGGFTFNTTPELFARWMQLGAFYPFCRNHTAVYSRKQEPYRFGKRVEDITRRYLKLRYRMMPFIYSLVWNTHLNGDPVWRPLSYEFPQDGIAARIEDQIMVGPGLMLAPVVHKGARERCLYLPGGKWTEFATGEIKKGPAWITVPAPLEHMPMFLRQGAIVPMGPAMRYTDELPLDPLTLLVAPGNGNFDLYEDDGVSMQYEKGAYAKTAVSVAESDEGIKIVLGKRTGNFSVPERNVSLRVITGKMPESITRDGKPVEKDSWKFESGAVEFAFQNNGEESLIDIVMAGG